jgi:hypothetical protein
MSGNAGTHRRLTGLFRVGRMLFERLSISPIASN